jgi:hypothetical protein
MTAVENEFSGMNLLTVKLFISKTRNLSKNLCIRQKVKLAYFSVFTGLFRQNAAFCNYCSAVVIAVSKLKLVMLVTVGETVSAS